MTTFAKALIDAKYAENAQTTQYTASNVRTIIDKFTVTNVSAGAEDFSANIVPGGDTAGASNLVLDAGEIAVGETYTCPELVGQVLNDGDFVSTLASAASALVIRASGREIS